MNQSGLKKETVYIESASSYFKEVRISNPESLQTKVIFPKDELSGQTILIILEAKDNSMPTITRYQRVIIKSGNTQLIC